MVDNGFVKKKNAVLVNSAAVEDRFQGLEIAMEVGGEAINASNSG